MSDSDLNEAVEFATEKAVDEKEDVMIYENEGSGIVNDFVVTLSKWGTPSEFPEIGRTFKVIAEIFYEDGNTRVAYAPSVNTNGDGATGDDIYEGREVCVVFESGELEKTEVVKVSERQIKTKNGMKFKKSDLSAGWGSEPSRLSLDIESFDRNEIPDRELNEIEQGDRVLNSNGSTVEVTDVTARQIKTNGENYKKSDGQIWGGGELRLIKKI